MKKKIQFICLGNICRSPMAEYLFKQIANERGLNIHIDSAGTSGWHDGEFMHVNTAKILHQKGIDTSDFVSRRVSDHALKDYDYLIVMDDNNLHDMFKRFGKHPKKIFKITELLPTSSPYDHVPDPWYTGNFVETCQILSECCQILVDKLQKQEL